MGIFEISAHTAPKVYKKKEDQQQHLEGDCYRVFDRAFLEERLDLFRELGITWFNTWANSDVYSDNTQDVALAAFLSDYLAKHQDIKLSSLHYIGSVFELNEDQDRVIKEQMQRVIALFKDCHPRCLVMHPGTFGDGRFKCHKINYAAACETYGVDKVKDLVADNIRYFGKLAAAHHIKIAVENLFEGRIFSKIDDLIDLVDRVNLENVGFCLDVGHAHVDGVDIPDAIRKMKGRLFELHLHDNLGADSHYPIGFGSINWYEVIRALKETDYQGTATFEFFRWPLQDAKQGIKQAILTWEVYEKLSFAPYVSSDYL